MAKFIVGLTGGIGSGKTTVATLFSEQGIELIDADIVARQVVEPGSLGLQQITHHFGTGVLTAQGTLNREKLRNIIFNSPSELEWLNQLLHPLIRTKMLKDVENANSPYVLMVVPLLFENGLDSLVNRTLVVDISPENQRNRVLARDNSSPEVIDSIIATQMGRQEKLSKADDVIDNQGQISALEQKVFALHQKYLHLSKI